MSSIGSLLTSVVVCNFCNDIMPAGRPVEGECDRIMVVAAASSAIATIAEVIRRFMGNLHPVLHPKSLCRLISADRKAAM